MNRQVKIGLKTESEHRNVYNMMKKGCRMGKCPTFKQFKTMTVQDHLREDKMYYTKLKKARL